jgi:hypothetical protein
MSSGKKQDLPPQHYSSALITIVNRKTDFTLTTQVDDKSAKTITADSVKGFIHHEKATK